MAPHQMQDKMGPCARLQANDNPGMINQGPSVGIDPDKVLIGQRVKVVFEHADDVWLPLFTPL